MFRASGTCATALMALHSLMPPFKPYLLHCVQSSHGAASTSAAALASEAAYVMASSALAAVTLALCPPTNTYPEPLYCVLVQASSATILFNKHCLR